MTRSSSCAFFSISQVRSFKKPLPSVAPHALHRAQLDPEHVRRLFVSQPEEVLDFHELAPFRIDLGKLIEEPVHRDRLVDFSSLGGQKVFHALQRDELRVRASARVVNQVPTHGSSSYSEKMPTIPPISILGRDQ